MSRSGFMELRAEPSPLLDKWTEGKSDKDFSKLRVTLPRTTALTGLFPEHAGSSLCSHMNGNYMHVLREIRLFNMKHCLKIKTKKKSLRYLQCFPTPLIASSPFSSVDAAHHSMSRPQTPAREAIEMMCLAPRKWLRHAAVLAVLNLGIRGG